MICKEQITRLKPLAYLLLLAVASCGGGGSSDPATPQTPELVADGSSFVDGTSFKNAIDNKLDSYWAPKGQTGFISVTWKQPQTIAKVTITEAVAHKGNIGAWQLINEDDTIIMSGAGAGSISIEPLTTSKIIFKILNSKGLATVAEIAIAGVGDTPVTTPTIMLSGKATGTAVNLNWTARSINVVSQKIYRDTDDNVEGSVPIQENIANVNYTDGNLADGRYYYWLAVTDDGGVEHLSSAISAIIDTAIAPIDACDDLINNADLNWDQSSLTEQEKVACLASSLGSPVGYGSKTTGGYDDGGDSNLIVIKKPTDGSLVEQKVLDAIKNDSYNWIVFDKNDFKNDTDIAMYRLACNDPKVLAALDGASEAECLDSALWCENHGVSSSNCDDTFFNVKLNVDSIRGALAVPMIHSNTTIDGRGAKANFKYSGFEIGDSEDTPSVNVIITNMKFIGGGHTEDHLADPDMIRSTGGSHDIWIHQNNFEHTGDSAFDVKQGAYNISISFNKLVDVKRAALHGSSDSRPVNANIRTSIHNNLFVTTDENYANSHFVATGRRVPLVRFGQSHLFNNVFYGYRKSVTSVRDGGAVFYQNNMFLNNANNAEKDDLDFWIDNLFTSDLIKDTAGLKIEGTYVWLANSACQLAGLGGDLNASIGTGNVPNMLDDYDSTSKTVITANIMTAGQDLADYVYATAGKGAITPYLNKDSESAAEIIAKAPDTCQ